MKIRTVIADDEEPARNELFFQLARLEDVEVVGQATNGLEALELIESLRPDLSLLDVQMPGLTGFEIVRALVAKKIDSRVVFVTAYDQYAIEAFKINAVDYLLKPVEPNRLSQTLTRVRELLASDARGDSAASKLQAEALEKIASFVENQPSRPDPIAIKNDGRLALVQSDDIVFISLVEETVTVTTGTMSGESNCRTLDELQAQLDPAIFWRLHRSHIVNIHKIKEIVPWLTRNYILKMRDSNGTEIPVSRTQTKRLRDYLNL